MGDGVVASTRRCCPAGFLRKAISLRSVRLRTFRFAKRCSAQDDTAWEFLDSLLDGVSGLLFPLIRAHELTFGQDVAFHRRKELFLGRARLQVELPVQRAELEEVSMGFAGGRGGAAPPLLVGTHTTLYIVRPCR